MCIIFYMYECIVEGMATYTVYGGEVACTCNAYM